MAVAAVEIYRLGLEERKRFGFVMEAPPCRKYLLPTLQVCWSDMLKKAWTKRVWEISQGLEIRLTGTVFCCEQTL